ncbi:unnamed protein product [Urochloa humidicola]
MILLQCHCKREEVLPCLPNMMRRYPFNRMHLPDRRSTAMSQCNNISIKTKPFYLAVTGLWVICQWKRTLIGTISEESCKTPSCNKTMLLSWRLEEAASKIGTLGYRQFYHRCTLLS